MATPNREKPKEEEEEVSPKARGRIANIFLAFAIFNFVGSRIFVFLTPSFVNLQPTANLFDDFIWN